MRQTKALWLFEDCLSGVVFENERRSDAMELAVNHFWFTHSIRPTPEERRRDGVSFLYEGRVVGRVEKKL